jgi:hypothetical protein
MLRRVVCCLFVLALCVGITLAEEFSAAITKVADGKVTFAKTKFDKDTKKLEKGKEETLPVDDKVKVVKGKFNKETMKLEAGDAIEGGLKNEMFTKIGEKGVNATIVTDKDNKKITEIRVFTFGGIKKKDK